MPPLAKECLIALHDAGLENHISIGGALGLMHYFEYRPTYDADAWWSEEVTTSEKAAVLEKLESTLAKYGAVRKRNWGDVNTVEVSSEGRTIFSFQIAHRSARIEEPIRAGWIDVPLDTIRELVAAKMVAMIERGAPRDFLDIYNLCSAGIVHPVECWKLWKMRQTLAGNDTSMDRARLAIQTHMERIALHRPLETIDDESARLNAERVRRWFSFDFSDAQDA